MSVEEEALKSATRCYWEKQHSKSIGERLKWYICEGQPRLGGASLLQAELDWMREKGNASDHPATTLVLLVGLSPEPLLQSVCVYQPKEVVLLLNEEGYAKEEWQEYAAHMVAAVGRLKDAGLIPELPRFLGEKGKSGYPVEASPKDVFQRLVRILGNIAEGENVVIDVTGGKKSMVAGAYLYAAYAGVRISYVDFDGDAYDPTYGRPYGYRCRIGELANPYREFALRQWEQVRKMYENYQFAEARAVLGGREFRDAMNEYLADSADCLDTLDKVLEYYELWDAGDYRGAWSKGEAIEGEIKTKRKGESGEDFPQPSAVTELGGIWFEADATRVGLFSRLPEPRQLYEDHRKFAIYVTDEIARIQRLIEKKEDYRSAFVRAGGVNELIMLKRLVDAVADPNERNRLLGALEPETPRASAVFKALQMTSFTIGKNGHVSWRGGPDPPIQVNGHNPIGEWWQGSAFENDQNGPGWDRFLKLRNKLAHTHLSVPREWAEEALKFVKANHGDWLRGLGQHAPDCRQLVTRALEWPCLVELIGLDRFLPLSLRR